MQISQHQLHEVGRLTGTMILHVSSADNSQFNIQSDDTDFISNAVAKLQCLGYHMKLLQSAPYISNLHYCEAEANLTFQMASLKSLRDRRLATTLLDPAATRVKGLSNYMCVVVLEKDQDGTTRPPQQAVPQDRILLNESQVWRHHRFAAFQNEVDQVWLQPKSNGLPSKQRASMRIGWQAIDDWSQRNFERMSIEDLPDPFKPLPEEIDKFNSIAKTEETALAVNPKEVPARKRHVKKRRPQGTVEDHSDRAELDIDNHVGNVGTQHILPLESVPTAHKAPINPNQIDFPELTELRAPTRRSPLNTENTFKVMTKAEILRNERSANHNDSQVPNGLAHPLNRKTPTTDMRPTMKQRKARSLTDETFSGGASTALKDALRLCRCAVGRLDLNVKIGRLLVNPKTGSSEFKNKTFTPAHWQSVFPQQSSTLRDCDFTPRLTTHAPDADFIVQLKYPSGSPLFQEASGCSVTYRFHLGTSHGALAILELGEEGNFDVYAPSQLLGAINWHYPKRYWDSRLEVNLSPCIRSAQRAKIQDLVDNVSLIPSFDGRSVKVVVKNAQLSITGIDLERKTTHNSEIYPTVALLLTHVEQLDVEIPGNGTYTAQSQATGDGIRQGKSWWEATLHSTFLSELYKENESLELGEMTRWTEQDVMESNALSHLEYFSHDLVTRIDSVGYYNSGPKQSSGTDRSSGPGLETQDHYW